MLKYDSVFGRFPVDVDVYDEGLVIDILGIVESMNGLVCPHCQEIIFPFGRVKGEDFARTYDLPLLASIPLDPRAVEAGDNGQPLVLQAGESPAKKALATLAANVIQRCG